MGNNISGNDLCFGCRACEKSCGKNAIVMSLDEEGFLRPTLDEEKCVECGLCLRSCPVVHGEDIKRSSLKVYAAQAKDEDILMKSSSGGMISVIADFVLSNNGVVFGAAYDENLNVRHVKAESVAELEGMRGSKYFQSDTCDTYVSVKQELKNGRLVYYTGTPCQIAGLRLFLRKEYSNLVTSDLICHGTPSSKIFHLFLKQMEKERFCRIVDYHFRDKRKGWGCSSSSSSSMRFNRFRTEIMRDYNMEAYFSAFIKGHITRMDCYKCKFCTPNRVGDITIADYWGIEEQHPEFPGNYKLGVSLVLVNTQNGANLWDAVKAKLRFCESSVEQIMKTDNKNYYMATPKPKEREMSYREAFSDFKKFRRRYMYVGWLKYNLRILYNNIKKWKTN